MALLKEVEFNNSGIICEYWRISGINSIFVTSGTGAFVMLEGYTDKQARIDGKSPIDRRNFNISQEDYAEFFDTDITRATAYAYLKAQEPKEDSENPMVAEGLFFGAEDI